MFEIRTEVEIDATPECVWDVLLDFRAYQSWNPFLRYVGGTPKVGHRLEVRARPSGGHGMTFRPTVLAAERPRQLRWVGRLLIPGILEGDHRFVIEPLSKGGARLHQSERFRGIFSRLLRRTLERDTRRGFTEMNG